MSDRVDETAPESKLDELMQVRRAKVAALRDRGVEPYPVRFDVTHTVAAVRAEFGDLDAGTETRVEVAVAGRLVAKRGQGKLAFGVLDDDGSQVQLFVQTNVIGAEGMAAFEDLDIGDWVGATGEVMATRRGELSVRPRELTLLGKNIRPLPDSWYGLKDVELRSRRREVDLAVNPDARRVFAIRSKVVKALRDEMDQRGFVEVETPILHPIPGGATARPFVTHHNALDTDLYLRVAPELYLKRLVAGGMPKVYEINRSFRNEGIDRTHNPEYTMLESYQAHADYHDVMDLFEALVSRAAVAALGTTEIIYRDRELSLAPPYHRRPMLELVQVAAGRDDLDYDTPVDELRKLCHDHGIAVEDGWGSGKLVAELYEQLVEDTIWEPTLVTDHPVETSPLARRHRSKPHVTERFEPIIAGAELGNAFSELTDPDDQRARFEAQARARAGGDDEAMALDEAYLQAMEIGMPPMGGLGLGVDRLVMLLADVANIRDVILFPTLRPQV